MIPPSTPIHDALAALQAARTLTAAEVSALSDPLPTGVWIYADLIEVARRGELEKRDKQVAKKILGKG